MVFAGVLSVLRGESIYDRTVFFFVQIRMKLSPGMSTYAFVNPVETELQLPPINNITPPQLIVFVMTRN
jgi:uncharacterized membrane protein